MVNQMVLKALLEPAGIEPSLVGDGVQAIEAWRSGDWDLILMDIQMPVLDGLTATRRIREAEAAEGRRRTPIIALTANVMPHQVATYRAAGVEEVVAKPLEAAALYAAIERCLEEAEALRLSA